MRLKTKLKIQKKKQLKMEYKNSKRLSKVMIKK